MAIAVVIDDGSTTGRASIAAHNALLKQLATANGAVYHTTTMPVISVADATNLATSLTLTNALAVALYNPFRDPSLPVGGHLGSTLLHKNASAGTFANAALITGTLTTLANAITVANELKADYNTARTEGSGASNVHFTDDATNVIATADATDQTSLNALVNDIKAKYNAHVSSDAAAALGTTDVILLRNP